MKYKGCSKCELNEFNAPECVSGHINIGYYEDFDKNIISCSANFSGKYNASNDANFDTGCTECTFNATMTVHALICTKCKSNYILSK